jgi:hypothetical protein
VGPTTASTASSSSSASKKSDKKGLFGIGRILSERELPTRKSSLASQGKYLTIRGDKPLFLKYGLL